MPNDRSSNSEVDYLLLCIMDRKLIWLSVSAHKSNWPECHVLCLQLSAHATIDNLLTFLHCVTSFCPIQLAALECYRINILQQDTPNRKIRCICMYLNVLVKSGNAKTVKTVLMPSNAFWQCSFQSHGLFFFNNSVNGVALAESSLTNGR